VNRTENKALPGLLDGFSKVERQQHLVIFHVFHEPPIGPAVCAFDSSTQSSMLGIENKKLICTSFYFILRINMKLIIASFCLLEVDANLDYTSVLLISPMYFYRE